MSKSGISRANQNKAIRQEALRESLAAGGHVQHVLDISNKLQDLKGEELNATDANRLKAAADIKLKLIDKYLASLQSVQQDMTLTDTRSVISAEPKGKNEFDAEYSVGTPEGATESIN